MVYLSSSCHSMMLNSIFPSLVLWSFNAFAELHGSGKCRKDLWMSLGFVKAYPSFALHATESFLE
jgi:hypothetical protein